MSPESGSFSREDDTEAASEQTESDSFLGPPSPMHVGSLTGTPDSRSPSSTSHTPGTRAARNLSDSKEPARKIRQPQRAGKRAGRRNPVDDDDDDADEDENTPKRSRVEPADKEVDNRRFLACPFAKSDTLKYRNCFSKKLDTISHLK
jgi:hypothetical protein